MRVEDVDCVRRGGNGWPKMVRGIQKTSEAIGVEQDIPREVFKNSR